VAESTKRMRMQKLKQMARFVTPRRLFHQRQDSTDNVIGTLHHLACTGGTIISKSLAAMTQSYVLSEIHPYRASVVRFDPMAAIAQFAAQYGKLTRAEARSALACQLAIIARRAQKDGRRLVIRDHSHSDFYAPGGTFEASLLLVLREMGYQVRSAVTIRDPIESYISICKNRWDEGHSFDEFCNRLLRFLDVYQKLPVYRYEDFCQNPGEIINGLCDFFRIPYEADFQHRVGDRCLTGDSGRSGTSIIPRPNKPVPEALGVAARRSQNYARFLKAWPVYHRELS
jgi:hypothetical protein